MIMAMTTMKDHDHEGHDDDLEFLVANFPNVDQRYDLDEEVNEILSEIPQGRKVLVTNHAVFAYFADSYGFEDKRINDHAQRLASLADELSSNSRMIIRRLVI